MQELVRERARQLFQHALRVLAAREPPLRALELVPARALGGIAHRADRGNDLAAAEPVHEIGDVVLDDHLGLRHGVLAHVEAFARDLAEIVDGIEEHVVERADLRFDVARHGEIEHQHRAVLARLERAFDEAFADERQRRSRGAHDDVVQRELRGQIVQRNDAAEEAVGELLGARFACGWRT